MIRWQWSYALDALEHISDSYGAMLCITQSTSFIRMELCSVSYKAHLLSVWSYAPCVEVACSTRVGADPTVDEYVLYQEVKERVLYIVERDRGKMVTGGGR